MTVTLAPNDGRLLANRRLNDRQRATLQYLANSEAGVKAAEIGDKVIRAESGVNTYPTECANRTLKQLAVRGLVTQLKKDLSFKITAKGRKAIK